MNNIIKGNAFIFGNNIDTDQIYPGRYLELVNHNDIAEHCLEGADPSFVQKKQTGDIVVAGTNFGCGSSREHAAITLVSAGVSVVLAESFARIFFRNGLNLALPLMVCPGINNAVKDGDQLEVNLDEGLINNLTTGECLQGKRISDYAMQILDCGGIKNFMKNKMGTA